MTIIAAKCIAEVKSRFGFRPYLRRCSGGGCWDLCLVRGVVVQFRALEKCYIYSQIEGPPGPPDHPAK
jgi:hypothetical protein